jgi:hypothetical protein
MIGGLCLKIYVTSLNILNTENNYCGGSDGEILL